MEIKTHPLANRSVLGKPVEIVNGVSAVVELVTDDGMVVDGKGLVHGGFAYGLADYAAMLAVNHPNVVLGKSRVESVDGKKHVVKVKIFVDEKKVFIGEFTCYVLDTHVLLDKST